MPHPTPEFPTNVQHTNPYQGLDRGLFKVITRDGSAFCRVHAARWTLSGPLASIGYMEFKLMQYPTMPSTEAEFMAGTIVQAPGGGEWFDCLTKGLVTTPIYAEYWGSNIFYAQYREGGLKLTDEEKAMPLAQAKVLVETMAKVFGLKAVELTATFDAVDGKPLSLTSLHMGMDYEKDGVVKHAEINNFPVGQFDPVRLALNELKTL